MVQDPIQVEELVRSVLVEIRFGNILAIQRIVLVELDDPLDQRRLVSKIDVIEKTRRIEFAVDQGIAPINRQAPRRHGLDDFFGRVPGKGGVLERDVELVPPQELDLAPRSPRHLVPDVVEDRKSTRLNSSHVAISYAVFCLKKKKRTKYSN